VLRVDKDKKVQLVLKVVAVLKDKSDHRVV